MKGFVILLLGVIFVALIADSIQSISADHLEPGQGIFADKGLTNIVDTKGSKYQIYLQAVIRNGDGQLISVAESMANGAYIPHKITDHAFDTLMGEKEIIIIDSIRYEKVQYTYVPTLEYRFVSLYPNFAEITFTFEKTVDDVAKMYSTNKDYSFWKIHFCAVFKGHGYECVPIFQAMVPTMTLEPHDVVTQHWTILREMN